MNEGEKTLLGCFGAMAAIVVALVVSPILNGYVLSVIWGWFIVPVFGAPALSIPYAIGFALVVGYLTNHSTGLEPKDKDKSEATKLITGIGIAIFRPLFILLFARVVLAFV